MIAPPAVRDWTASYGIWIFWLALFLVLENLPFVWAGCPWTQLSGTTQHAERSYPIVRALVFGFLIGLLIHLVYEVKMWQAMIFGFGVSLLTHFVHFRQRV
jgi:hypothetical protein